jgi:hypothetical protein
MLLFTEKCNENSIFPLLARVCVVYNRTHTNLLSVASEEHKVPKYANFLQTQIALHLKQGKTLYLAQS